MKMVNIASRAGIEPTSLVFGSSVLTIKSTRLPGVLYFVLPILMTGGATYGGTLHLIAQEKSHLCRRI